MAERGSTGGARAVDAGGEGAVAATAGGGAARRGGAEGGAHADDVGGRLWLQEGAPPCAPGRPRRGERRLLGTKSGGGTRIDEMSAQG